MLQCRSDFFANVTDPTCGEYLQLTSLYPGRGPCYPVMVETVDYFNRCIFFPLCLLAPSFIAGERFSGCMYAGKPACRDAPAFSAGTEDLGPTRRHLQLLRQIAGALSMKQMIRGDETSNF